MAAKEDIAVQFDLFNIKPSEAVLSKCTQMCRKYNISGEDLVDQWFAYTTSVLRGEAPTVDHLERMERKEFAKNKPPPPAFEDHRNSSSTASPAIVAPNGSDFGNTPKGNHHAAAPKTQTPGQSRNLLEESMDVSFGESSASSGQQYTQRADALTVVCSYGSSKGQFKATSDVTNIAIAPVYDDGLKPKQRIMFEILRKRGRCIDNMIEDLARAIADKYQLVLREENEEIVEEIVVLYGRIVSDCEGKLNNQSVLLEQTQKFRGRCVSLNFSKLSEYLLFPGQVVVVKGSYLRALNNKDKLVVHELYCDTTFDLPVEPIAIQENLQIIIACGPFTVADNLAFEPLNDLLRYVKTQKPHVLILTGPFYDKNNDGIRNGELKETFDDFFADLVNVTMKELESEATRVVVVASAKEPHHYPVYPTPPYEATEHYKNLTFMPDPCMVNVNGVVIGATTADVLIDIGRCEHYVNKTNLRPPERMTRLASCPLKQQSFYPLDPPGKDVHIDYSLMERNGVMGVKPHILILPSNLKYFIKEIDQCLVINPERLTKGNIGGTFARLEIGPAVRNGICGATACEILKI